MLRSANDNVFYVETKVDEGVEYYREIIKR